MAQAPGQTGHLHSLHTLQSGSVSVQEDFQTHLKGILCHVLTKAVISFSRTQQKNKTKQQNQTPQSKTKLIPEDKSIAVEP